MPLQLPDKWVWDFWFAQDGDDHHIFYLQAPHSLGNPEIRHWHASIGHAVSKDLKDWKVLPGALSPSKDKGAWDDYTTWTGSIIQHYGLWYLFYTGTSLAEQGLIQRIGLATSDDLITWQRHPGNPIMEVDTHWYEALDLDTWYEETWRDPWVFEYNGTFHALITARTNQGDKSSRGVIGYASSTDLLNWNIRSPITEPGEFGYLEVPQLVEINGRWYLFFCVEHERYSRKRLECSHIKQQTGIHYMVGDTPLGPFHYLSDDFLFGDEVGSLYAGKVIQSTKAENFLMACHQFTPEGTFVGRITDPLPLNIQENGQISLNY